MRGRVELPSLDRQSRIMTVIWTHLNLWKFRYYPSSLTTVGHCCRLFWWMRLDLNQQCHYDGRFTVSWGYQFSYTSKNMVEHSGVEPLLVDWKPTVLTDRRMLHYMKTHLFRNCLKRPRELLLHSSAVITAYIFRRFAGSTNCLVRAYFMQVGD